MNLGVFEKNVKDTDIKRINVHTFKCLIAATSYTTTLNLSYIFQPFSDNQTKRSIRPHIPKNCVFYFVNCVILCERQMILN